MFTVIKAPNYDKLTFTMGIFMGGGITGTTEWQETMIELLAKEKLRSEITLVNPRRPDFDVTNPAMEREHISWEEHYLKICKAALFWFPPETLCPITLFELGRETQRKSRLYVGYDPGYKRKRDVKIQLELCRPDIKVVNSLEDLAHSIAEGEGRDRT